MPGPAGAQSAYNQPLTDSLPRGTMKTPVFLHPAILVMALQFVSTSPSLASPEQQDLADTFNPSPPYFQRFQRLFRDISLAQDPNYRNSLFQFQRKVAKGVNSLSSASVLEEIAESVRRSWAGEWTKPGLSGSPSSGSPWSVQAEPPNVSSLCANQSVAVLTGLATNQAWVAQFQDSMGKQPSGVLQGASIWPGAYEECNKIFLNTTAFGLPSIYGKYCTSTVYRQATADVPMTTLTVGVCLPASCSEHDMTIVLNAYLQEQGIKEMAYVTCVPEEKTLDTKAIVAIVICSILLCCMLAGTALDVLYVQQPRWRQDKQETVATSIDHQGQLTTSVEESLPLVAKKKAVKTTVSEIGVCSKLLMAFSVYTNSSKMMSTAQPAGSLKSIHGVRFLSMTWVVLGHAYAFSPSFAGNSWIFYPDIQKRWTFQAVGNATVSVDSFFVISGLLVAYLSLKEMKKRGGNLNWFLFYFHRFWRLTPAYMLVIMVYTCLSPYWGWGPFWPGRDHLADRLNCEKYWWTNLLYVNNVVHSDKMCLGQSWYLANDMQFYVLSPLIFVPFYFSPILGCISSGLFLLGSTIAPGVVERNHYFPPGSFAQLKGDHKPVGDYMSYFYVKPWNRMGPYVIGLMAGYVLYRCNCKLRINKFLNLFLWAAAAGSAMGVLYGLYDAGDGHPISIEVASLYVAVSRTVWGLCVAWVVVACCTGNGGFVDMLLSWSGLVPLSRLTYCIYLLHIMIMDLYMTNQQTLFYLSDMNIVLFFLGILVVSYMAAYVTSLAFEAPMMGLEKILLRKDSPPTKAQGNPGQTSNGLHHYTNGAANAKET